MQQPKSVLEECSEERLRIQERLSFSYEMDELAIERLKRKLRGDLKVQGHPKTYAGALHLELAYLLGVQGKIEADAELDFAEKCGVDRIAVSLSRSHIALMNGRICSARVIVEELSRMDDLPEGARPLLTAHFSQAGMLEELMKTQDLSHDLTRETAAAQILQAIGVADIELTKRLDTACRVIRANANHPILGMKLFAMENEGIMYRYVVKASDDELIELNDKVLDALIEQHDGPLDQQLSIGVVPWTPDEQFILEAAYHVRVN
ncbi:hypothetical protein [Pseudomonas sp. WMBT8]|uniref:hypothetical protein n=1 Tax=Pseudomonas sp. WMBT8 TaxID=3414496 RepID=UPI003D8042A3